MIGETISHYRILERLGVGGMGEVYKAEDTRLHRPVALKLMLQQNGQSDEHSKQMRARFLREAQAASALNHPNIATIYEIDEVVRDGEHYSFIVMEFVPGPTLKQASKTLTIAQMLDVATQIAGALNEAHAHGIVHRDIKPSNVILTEQQRAKLLDFGVAKYNPLVNSDSQTASLYQTDLMKTAPGQVFGTFAYMSPEQALGQEVDGRSDIFSLGVMLYEMLAGRLPFTGSSMLATIDAILHAEPLPISTFNSQVTADLERIVHWMLEKEPLRRYQAMSDLIKDLEAAKQGLPLPTLSFETNTGYSTQPLSAQQMGTRTLGKRAGKSVAVLSFNNITKNPADDWLGGGIAETVTADLKKIEGITVIGRERVYETLRRHGIPQDAEVDTMMATSLGREVGARWILTGGYQKIAEMLRITARVVDVETGEVFRTVKIDGLMKEIFDLQDKIVFELSQGLDLSIRSGEREGIEQKETEVLEAYEALSKAEARLMSGDGEQIEEAVKLLVQAIALDPNYARAYAGLGYAYTLEGQFFAKPEMLETGVEFFQKAIELQPMLAESYAGLGMAFVALGRDDDAMGALRRALSFASENADVHSSLGRVFAIGKGLFREAIAEYQKALKINPEDAWSAQQIALCCAYVGEYELGEEAARQAIQAQEDFTSGHEGIRLIGSHVRLAHLYNLQGRYYDAISECYREIVFLRQSNHALKERTLIEVHQKLVSAYVRQGNPEDARAAFEQVAKGFEARLARGADEPFTRYYVACAAAMMGNKNDALEHLAKAIEGRRNFNAARARVEIDFEGLRAEAGFQELITH
ncbi:MAG TPA: FlgO family outer membrane protein [Blastocatellia bacterium]|nr:FlgO family outer membrane protein [Blastocatellia bacterium]HMX27437.1 FlgO family outer membrane protein [Blastocatellia bacterium]HMZ18095.1 FlgO family outer membrane protein [Blastocatellia bacterium]HNG30639.1 FlgO family outer membrane protein [Blastocatellia bacterium]